MKPMNFPARLNERRKTALTKLKAYRNFYKDKVKEEKHPEKKKAWQKKLLTCSKDLTNLSKKIMDDRIARSIRTKKVTIGPGKNTRTKLRHS